MELANKQFSEWPSLADFFEGEWVNKGWKPAVNIVNNESNYEIQIAAPGTGKDSFDVKVENGMVIVNCKVESSSEEKEKNYTRREFSSRSFSRSFTIPQDADDEVEASYTDGVLSISLKKVVTSEPKKKQVVIQ